MSRVIETGETIIFVSKDDSQDPAQLPKGLQQAMDTVARSAPRWNEVNEVLRNIAARHGIEVAKDKEHGDGPVNS